MADVDDVDRLQSATAIIESAVSFSVAGRDFLLPPRFRSLAINAWRTEEVRFGRIESELGARRNDAGFRAELAAEGLTGPALLLKYEALAWTFDRVYLELSQERVGFWTILGLHQDARGLWQRDLDRNFLDFGLLRLKRADTRTRGRAKEVLTGVLEGSEPILESIARSLPFGNAAVEVKDVFKRLLKGRRRERPRSREVSHPP